MQAEEGDYIMAPQESAPPDATPEEVTPQDATPPDTTPAPAAPRDLAPIILSLDDLAEFRGLTERISAFLHKRLKDHLAALSPLLAPGRVLGKHAGGRESAPRADEALAELAEKFKQVCGSLLFLKSELDEETLSAIGLTIQIQPFEY